jgi:hypothetical protein
MTGIEQTLYKKGDNTTMLSFLIVILTFATIYAFISIIKPSAMLKFLSPKIKRKHAAGIAVGMVILTGFVSSFNADKTQQTIAAPVKASATPTATMTPEQIAAKDKADADAKAKADADAKAKADADAKAKADANVPTEYKSALKKAELYAKTMNMSKNAINDQLTSDYGEKFSKESAKYAIDNLQFDWKANALKKADSYAKTMNMSKQGIYDQIVSDNGEKFTEEEAQYAVDNIKADFNNNALNKAKDYQNSMKMSPAAIRDQLTSNNGEKFTKEEADYAIKNLDK